MLKRFKVLLIFSFLCLAALISCHTKAPVSTSPVKPTLSKNMGLLPESKVNEIDLEGPISNPRAEISGMAWCGEDLVLLPQYPQLFGDEGEANVFGISQDSLEDYISNDFSNGITPVLIPFDTGGFEKNLPGFEGFEAIVFNQSDFYVSIEAREGDQMRGYLVRGSVDSNCSRLVLDPDSLVSMQLPADIGNMSYETLVICQNELYAIYEANGINVNRDPAAQVFDLSLESHSTVDLPNIEYRLTDATQPDENGEFWAINYFFPGDASDLAPAEDQIALAYGVGVSHQEAEPVERLIKLRIGEKGVELVDQEPIYLALMEGDSRNWEGIVHFGEGFLLVTDRFPTTILAYVPFVSSN